MIRGPAPGGHRLAPGGHAKGFWLGKGAVGTTSPAADLTRDQPRPSRASSAPIAPAGHTLESRLIRGINELVPMYRTEELKQLHMAAVPDARRPESLAKIIFDCDKLFTEEDTMVGPT